MSSAAEVPFTPDGDPVFALVQDLFARATACDGAARDALLAQAEAEHGVALVAEVRSLLANRPSTGGWLEPPSRAVDWLEGAATVPDSLRAAALALGRLERIGPFRLVREVGRGGMGVVFEAVEIELGRRVALKVLPPQHQLDPRFLERFRREAQAAAGLAHENIIPVYGAGEADGLHYYAMQFVEGVTLDRLIADMRRWRGTSRPNRGSDPHLVDLVRTPIPSEPVRPGSESSRAPQSRAGTFRDAAQVIATAADAVAHAHARGVLHRDLKPSNLILDRDGKVWVSDFGLARIEGSADLTRTGEMVGTLRYMPPESVTGAPDARGDVYSLGLILYELLTLTPAFDAPDRARLLAMVSRGSPLRPRRIDPTVPVDLETITCKAIDPLPVGRYPSATALADDLRAFLEARPIRARPPSLAHKLELAVRRHKAVAATIVAALLVIVAGTAFYVRHLTRALADAESARETAKVERNIADAKRADAEFRSYVAGIAAAQAALHDGDVAAARQHLDAAPEHLRGWEWRHVHARLDASLGTFGFEPRLVSDRRYDPSVSARFHPDGRRLLTLCDTQLRLWDLDTGTLVDTAEVRTSTTHRQFAWGPRAESFLYLRENSRDVEVWTLSPLAHAGKLRGPSAPRAIATDTVGERCAVGSGTGHVHLLAVATRTTLHRWDFAAPVWSVAFAPDDRSLAVAVGTEFVRIDLGTNEVERVCTLAAPTSRAMAFHPDGRLVAVFVEGCVLAIDVHAKRIEWSLPAVGGAFDLEFSPDGRHLAAALGIGGSAVWDLQDHSLSHASAAHGRAVTSVSFHPNGWGVATGGRDNAVRLFDLDMAGATAIVGAHARDTGTIRLSPDGRWLISEGARDGLFRLWEADTLERAGAEFDPPWKTLAFTPEGDLLTTPRAQDGEAFTVEVRGMPALTSLRSFPTPSRPRYCFFTPSREALFVSPLGSGTTRHSWPDGRVVWSQPGCAARAISQNGRILAGVHGTELTLVDAETGATLRPLVPPTHMDEVTSVCFFADDRRLATVGLDGQLCLWDVATGTCSTRITAHAHGITRVDASPDGTRLLTVARDGILKLWDTTRDAEVFSVRASMYWTYARFDVDGKRIVFWDANGGLGQMASESSHDSWALANARHALRSEIEGIAARLEASHDGEVAAALAELATQQDLRPEVRTGVENWVRSWPGEERWVLRHIWRTAIGSRVERGSADGDPTGRDRLDRAAATAAALVAASPTAERMVHLGMVRYRKRDPAGARRALTGDIFANLDPRLGQTRLAFLAMSHAVRGNPDGPEILAAFRAHLAERGPHIPPELVLEVEATAAKAKR